MYVGVGSDAKIRSVIKSPDGDRTTDGHYKWIDDWESCFAEPYDSPAAPEIYASYQRLMNSLTISFGIKHGAA